LTFCSIDTWTPYFLKKSRIFQSKNTAQKKQKPNKTTKKTTKKKMDPKTRGEERFEKIANRRFPTRKSKNNGCFCCSRRKIPDSRIAKKRDLRRELGF
jgi:hypothetical protein